MRAWPSSRPSGSLILVSAQRRRSSTSAPLKPQISKRQMASRGAATGRLQVTRRGPEMPETFAGELATALENSWAAIARPEQLPPPGDWTAWVYVAGRGAGKTRSGAEWVSEKARAGSAGRIALVAPTAADARDVM